jgi:hypothetical protein
VPRRLTSRLQVGPGSHPGLLGPASSAAGTQSNCGPPFCRSRISGGSNTSRSQTAETPTVGSAQPAPCTWYSVRGLQAGNFATAVIGHSAPNAAAGLALGRRVEPSGAQRSGPARLRPGLIAVRCRGRDAGRNAGPHAKPALLSQMPPHPYSTSPSLRHLGRGKMGEGKGGRGQRLGRDGRYHRTQPGAKITAPACPSRCRSCRGAHSANCPPPPPRPMCVTRAWSESLGVAGRGALVRDPERPCQP